MKIFILMPVFFLLHCSCRKNDASVKDLIYGKWEIRKETGGIGGTLEYKHGLAPVYFFRTDKTFQTNGFIIAGNNSFEGTFDIRQSARPGDWLLTLQYISLPSRQTISRTDSVRFENNQLIMLPAASCCDIPTVFLERVMF